MNQQHAPGHNPRLVAVFWVYSLVISIGLLWPALTVPEVIKRPDLIVHALVYGAFTFLLLAANPARITSPKRATVIYTLSAVVYGAFTELLQCIPILKRSGAVDDWLANVLGVGCGMVLLLIARRSIKRLSASRENRTAPTP